MAKTGRPVGSTKLTKEIKEKIFQAVRLGLPYDRAAQLAGINPRTFYYWKAKGQAGTAPTYVRFLQDLKKAEIEGEAAAINEIVKAARDGTWQAAAWLLERRYPDRWARVQKVEVSWRDQIMELIIAGTISKDDVIEELGDQLASELFESAGVSVASG